MSEIQTPVDQFTVSEQDKETIEGLVAKLDEASQRDERLAVISYEDLPNLFSEEEIRLINRVSAIDPTIYGFKGPKLPIEHVPSDLVRVEPQPYTYQGVSGHTDVQFIPAAPYEAFRQMAEAMKRGIGRKLLVESSYRSSAYQAITFLEFLKINNFDISKTAKIAAIPGYSQHGTPSQLALDFKNVDGIPNYESGSQEDFEGTDEYKWLVAHAAEFDFFLSYPQGNPDGIMFEPWHWQHRPSADS